MKHMGLQPGRFQFKHRPAQNGQRGEEKKMGGLVRRTHALSDSAQCLPFLDLL